MLNFLMPVRASAQCAMQCNYGILDYNDLLENPLLTLLTLLTFLTLLTLLTF